MARINGLNNKDKLLLSLTGISLCKNSTPKPDAHFYAKFTAKIVNNEATYFAVAVNKEKELIVKLA